MRLAWAPNVAPNDAALAIFSLTTSELTLSRPTPPYSSGTSTPSNPRSPARFTSRRASAQSLSSSRSSTGRTSFSTNSCAVCRDEPLLVGQTLGGEDASAAAGWSSHSPPRRVEVVPGAVVVAIIHILSKMPAAPMPPPTHIVTMPYRALPPLHLVEQRRRQLRAGAAERMAERDRAAVHVQPLRIDRQLLQAREHLRRERFVQLDEIDLIERQSRELQHLPDRRDRTDAEQLRLDAGRRERDEPRQRRQAALARAGRRGDDHRRRAVARLRRVAGRHRPVGVKRRPQLRQRLGGGVAPRSFVHRERDLANAVICAFPPTPFTTAR